MKLKVLGGILFSLFLMGCEDSNSGDKENEEIDGKFGFYDKQILLSELPDVYTDKDFIQEPSFSYNNVSEKGNDLGSTKKADLIKWHAEIRNTDRTSEDKYFAPYDGSTKIYADIPDWEGKFNIGVYSKKYAENILDYYNFMRALFGGQRVYMSGYKHIASQASSWSDLSGGHYPTLESAQAMGYSETLYNAIYDGRSSSNLMGGSVNKEANYAEMYHFPENANSALSRIWCEGNASSINGLGHRNSFMYYPGKDVGIGKVQGFFSWMSWGANPQNHDGNGLGAEEQQAIYSAYPSGEALRGMVAFPSHGYFPFFVFANNNQSANIKVNGSDVEPLDGTRDAGKKVTLTMEYFQHTTDGDLTTILTNKPYKTLIVSDIVGSSQEEGGESPGSNGKDYVPACETGDCPDGVVENGGYQFTTNHGAGIVFRMPQAWMTEMVEDFKTGTPKYHTVRYTFSVDGEALKVKQPFYMNETVGANFVYQTTFFDVLKHKN